MGPTNVLVDTNRTVAREYEVCVWGYGTAEAAWGAVVASVTNYGRVHTNAMYGNAGWVKGTREAHGEWGGYLWWLENEVAFETSATNIWVSPYGVTNYIARVLVGTIGDYEPMTNVVDRGPRDVERLTNYAGAGVAEDALTPADYRAFYVVLSVDFLDASKNPVSTLKVGKWENAFNAVPTVKDNFIDLDPDRFYVRVNDQSKKGTGKVSVKLSTDSDGTAYDDDATEIELNEEPANSGIFISTNMLMVSDDVDDDFTNPNVVADDTKNDRTHKVALGGKVKVQYPETETVICEKEATVPPDRKKVEVMVVILRDKAQADGGTPIISAATVSNHWKAVQERYAQVGVSVDWSGPSVEDPPGGVDLSDGLTVRTSIPSTTLATEAKSLLSALGTTNSTADIRIFYVNQAWVGANPAYGSAVADYWYDETEDPFTYNVFMSANAHLMMAAHELGHLLTDKGYQATVPTWNVMRDAAGHDFDNSDPTDSKRFDTDQEALIRANGHCIAP